VRYDYAKTDSILLILPPTSLFYIEEFAVISLIFDRIHLQVCVAFDRFLILLANHARNLRRNSIKNATSTLDVMKSVQHLIFFLTLEIYL